MKHAALLSSARLFFRDFRAFAGRDGGTAVLLIVAGAGLEGIGLAVLVPVLRGMMEGQARRLMVYLAGFTLLIGLRALVLWRRDMMLARLRAGFVEQQRARLVGRLVGAPWTKLARMRHARITHLLVSDVTLAGTCAHFMLQGAAASCLLAIQWGLAFLFSPPLALLSGLLLIGAGVALLPQLARSQRLGREVAEANLHLAHNGAQFLGGLKLAMSQNLQGPFAEEFNATLTRLIERQVDFTRAQSRAQLTVSTIASLAGAAAILAGFYLFAVPPPLLIVFVLLLARMSAPITQLQQGLHQFANFLPSYEAVKALESDLAESEPTPAPEALPTELTLRFDKVTYRHSEGGKGVFDLDLELEPGLFVGITGASGAGKTTFADLLVGLLAPQDGAISLGGRAMSEGLRARWRSVVAYAPQEAFLFHDSIGNNLRWADPAASDEQITAALRLAGAESFIGSLDSIVGERGALLSGGERQRLTLARALLRKAPLLMLDETTSAIDVPAERALLRRLAALPWRPTILLIAHRAESLALCHRIIEFADGRIVSDRHTTPAASAR
jgi:ATP-binding cassette subfamily C protein